MGASVVILCYHDGVLLLSRYGGSAIACRAKIQLRTEESTKVLSYNSVKDTLRFSSKQFKRFEKR